MSLYTRLDWVATLKFDNIYYVLDSKKVVDSFRTCIDDVTDFGCIMYDRKELFQNNFQNSHVELSRKQVNVVTHELTNVILCNDRSHLYRDDVVVLICI